MDQIHHTLSRFGLSDSEIKVYRQTLLADNLSPFKIAKLTNIPRTTVYEILLNLSLKGLVHLDQSDGFTKQQTRVRAHNPSILRDILHRKSDDLSRLEVDIVDILPELKGDYHRSEPNADFQFFPGIKGAKEIYFSETKSDSHLPIWAFENLMPMDAFGRQTINSDIDRWLAKHSTTKAEMKEIVGLTPWSKHVLSYQFSRNPKYFEYRQTRCIDDPHFFINQRLFLQGDTLKISTIHQEESWGLNIKSPSLVATFRSIFQFIWSQAIPVTPALIKSWGPNEFFQAERRKSLYNTSHRATKVD